MWRCPVCEKEHVQGSVCDDCGFDSSCDYERNRTLCSALPKHVEPISVRAAKWRRRQKQRTAVPLGNHLVCPRCGGKQFFFLIDELRLMCTDCETKVLITIQKDGPVSEKDVNPIPEPEPAAPEPGAGHARGFYNYFRAGAGPSATPELENAIAGGKAGPFVTWTLSDTGVLTIAGSGWMDSYGHWSPEEDPPWEGHKGKITSVVVKPRVTKIGDCAFDGCSSLTSIALPEGVTEIGRRAFSECTGLTSIALPESVTEIDWRAFSGCASLTSITLPKRMARIGYGAFRGCAGLTDIYYGSTEEQWRNIEINGDNDDLRHVAIHYNS